MRDCLYQSLETSYIFFDYFYKEVLLSCGKFFSVNIITPIPAKAY